MSKNQKTAVAALLAVALIALVPLFALKGAEFGGSDDAGGINRADGAVAARP